MHRRLAWFWHDIARYVNFIRDNFRKVFFENHWRQHVSPPAVQQPWLPNKHALWILPQWGLRAARQSFPVWLLPRSIPSITKSCQKYGRYVFLIKKSLKCSCLFYFYRENTLHLIRFNRMSHISGSHLGCLRKCLNCAPLSSPRIKPAPY